MTASTTLPHTDEARSSEFDADAKPNLPHIALVGNPNTGKSTLFNRLTGLRQRIGNYPGVTVEKKLGTLTLPAGPVTMVDLPGCYSLAATSPDERLVLDALVGRIRNLPKPELVVCVIDATHLTRNLFLASQIADLGLPMVLVLNMIDQAEAQQMQVNATLMSERFGVPVVPVAAHKGRGMEDLKKAIARALDEKPTMAPTDWPQTVIDASQKLRDQIREQTSQTLAQAEAYRLIFDSHSSIADRVDATEEQLNAWIDASRQVLRDRGYHPMAVEPVVRYEQIATQLGGVVQGEPPRVPRSTETIDRLLTHRVGGLVVFAGMMWLVFTSIYAWAGPFMDAIDMVFGALGESVGGMLASTPMLQSLVVDGLIGGVGGVIIFVPQIAILFFFIALLEDTGYMARAAFLMDKLFGWCGLSGRSFVPLLSSYACAIPGIMAARSIEDPKARLTTVLIAPLMSCSARLPVYVLLIGAFIEPRYGVTIAGMVLLAMHFVGLAVSIPIAYVVNRFLLKTKPQPFLMEIPPYRVPRLADVLMRMWQQSREFIIRAGTVILAMTIVIWALLYFPQNEQVAEQATQQHVASVAEQWNMPEQQVLTLAEGGTLDRIQFAQSQTASILQQSLSLSPERATQVIAGLSSLAVAELGDVAPESTLQLAEAVAEIDQQKIIDMLSRPDLDIATATVDTSAELVRMELSHTLEQVDQSFGAGLERAVDAAMIEQSYMGRFGKAVQPIFEPAGFDWKITVGILASFPAREVIISTLGTVYSLGGEVDESSGDLRAAMASAQWGGHTDRAGLNVFSPLVAVALMVFFALCSQCGATIATIGKEVGWRWAILSFTYMTVLAWVAAVGVYQVGSLFI